MTMRMRSRGLSRRGRWCSVFCLTAVIGIGEVDSNNDPQRDQFVAAARRAVASGERDIEKLRLLVSELIGREKLATILVRDMLHKYPRLLGLRIFAHTGAPPKLCIVASQDPKELGQAGEKVEKDVVARDVVYTGKNSSTIVVTMPLHDRNGEVVGVVRVTLKPFMGQTEQNAIARALPIVKQMEQRVRSAEDLLQ